MQITKNFNPDRLIKRANPNRSETTVTDQCFNSCINIPIVSSIKKNICRSLMIEELKNGKVESAWVAEILGRPVVKAFNNLLAHSLEYGSKSEGAERRMAMAVSGDDGKSKKIISDLINDAGFDAVDAGSISESWRHQPGTPAYCTELNGEELKQALIDGVKVNAPGLRDFVITKLMEGTSQPSHEEILALNRSLFPKNPKSV